MPPKKAKASSSRRLESPPPAEATESSSSSPTEEDEEESDEDESMEVVEPEPEPEPKKKKKEQSSKEPPKKMSKKKDSPEKKKKKKKKSEPVKSGIKKKKKNFKSFGVYIFKVMKQVHRDSSISRKAMVTMDNFMMDIFERIASEVGSLCKKTNKKTMSARDVEAATKLILPGELSRHAVSEATKALHLYKKSL